MKTRLNDKCPECSSINLIHDYDTGETVCGDCGLVLQERTVDKGPEWRAYTPEEEETRSRVGAPTTLTIYDKGLSTAIGRVDRDAFGRKLPLSTRLQMWRLRKWQIRSRVHFSKDRNLAKAMNKLDLLSDKLYIPGPVKEQAAVIYRKALDKSLVRGRSIEGMTVAALYLACRLTETTRALEEIAEASLVGKKEVARSYRLLLKELSIRPPVPNFIPWVSKIAEKVGISGETQGLAIKILCQAREKRFTVGKESMGLAAAALYIACLQNGRWVSQIDLADAAEVTEVTVRNRYKQLVRVLKLDLKSKTKKKSESISSLVFYFARNRNTENSSPQTWKPPLGLDKTFY